MWIVKLVTFIEYHPYLSLIFALVIWGIVWFFWREHKRPSYQQQNELKELLKKFDAAKKSAKNDRTEK